MAIANMVPIKSCCMTFLLLATCSLVAQCALEPSMATDSFPDNADEKGDDAIMVHKRPSFFVGSRYGRSGAGTLPFASSKTRRLNVVPRNDRFFLGSRYGKRSGEYEYMSPYEQDHVESSLNPAAVAAAATTANKSTGSGAPYMMSCIYTGLKNFYRCSNIEEINNIIHQLTTANTDDDDDDK